MVDLKKWLTACGKRKPPSVVHTGGGDHRSGFAFGLKKQGTEQAEEDGGRDAPGGGGHAPGEGPGQTGFADRLVDPFGQQVAKAGQGDGGTRSTPFDQIFIQPQAAQHHPGNDIKDQNAGGGQAGLVDEELSDDAE